MSVRVRRRPYVIKVREVESGATTDRQTLLTPAKGYRARLVQVKVLQDASDGRHLLELYFGEADNIITEPSKGIDILAVPDEGSASTRVFLKDQGPRGLRDEVLSARWRGRPPDNPHKILIQIHRGKLVRRPHPGLLPKGTDFT